MLSYFHGLISMGYTPYQAFVVCLYLMLKAQYEANGNIPSPMVGGPTIQLPPTPIPQAQKPIKPTPIPSASIPKPTPQIQPPIPPSLVNLFQSSPTPPPYPAGPGCTWVQQDGGFWDTYCMGRPAIQPLTPVVWNNI